MTSDTGILGWDSTFHGNYSGVQAEGYKLSRKARIKPFKTSTVSTTVASSRDESFNGRLKTKSLQPIYLSRYDGLWFSAGQFWRDDQVSAA